MGGRAAVIALAAINLWMVSSVNSHTVRLEKSALFSNKGHKIVEFSIGGNPGVASKSQRCQSKNCLQWDDEENVLSLIPNGDSCQTASWDTYASATIKDCFRISTLHWFGGAEQKHQVWPLEKFENLSHSLVPVELESRAIADGLWYNSAGDLYFVDKGAPVFYEQNTTEQDYICLVGKLEEPYRQRERLQYSIQICSLRNAKEAFQYAIENFIAKPSGHPDERMVRYPIWSTWVRFKSVVNDTAVRAFAKEITDNGFKNSQLEIDDRWETCYGSTTFDTTRFPNMSKLSEDLHNDGFRVTLWSHIFIQLDCTDTLQEALSLGYVVKDTSNNTASTWWNGNASVVDFTNPDARDWWVGRHKKMIKENGIDGMKFDAGETSWMPQPPQLSINASNNEDYPGLFTVKYMHACAEFGAATEFRSAHYTQDIPLFIRMIDKDSVWGYANGLKTLVTTLLQMNSVGYSMVLPDMIGGNAYNGDVVTKELFIRWLQATTFMPALQYSLVPWEFDAETVTIAKKYADLHDEYTDTIIHAMQQCVSVGTPVNPPIWWLDPENDDALISDSEFLVGEDILVAPVLEDQARKRDIYLPGGTWLDGNNGSVYLGPKQLLDYPAPLDTLPYFLRMDNGFATVSPSSASADNSGNVGSAATISILAVAPVALLLP